MINTRHTTSQVIIRNLNFTSDHWWNILEYSEVILMWVIINNEWIFTWLLFTSDYWNLAYLQWCQLAILPNHDPQQISTREAWVKNFWPECEWPKFYHRLIGRHKWFQTNSNVPYFDLSFQIWTKCQIQLLHVGFLFVLVLRNNFPNVVVRLNFE